MYAPTIGQDQSFGEKGEMRTKEKLMGVLCSFTVIYVVAVIVFPQAVNTVLGIMTVIIITILLLDVSEGGRK